jgi:hypothetical protein
VACRGQAAYEIDLSQKFEEGGLPPKIDRQPEREATTARRVLAIHHLLDAANADLSNKAAEIRLIEFLTSRNEDDIAAKLIEIRERGNPADKRNKKVRPRSPKVRKEDLESIKPLFEDLRLTTIVNSIDEEIKDADDDA